MKAPNIFSSELRTTECGGGGMEIEMDDHTVALIYHHNNDHEFAEFLASAKSLAACLHKQMERLNAIDSWEFILRPTRQEMVDEMRKALLEAGYTE